jgi:RNA polymerase primary sigma factor
MQPTKHSRRAARRPIATYIRDIVSVPLLSADAERQLARRVADGDWDARNHIVQANLRLVVRLASGYTGKGLPLEDLVAEGNLGLIRAAELFDPSRGVRFSTYAGHWVRQSMRRALSNTSRTIRLPSYMLDLLARWHRAAVALREKLGRVPSDEEIAIRLGLVGKRLRVVREAALAGVATASEVPPGETEPLSQLAWPSHIGPGEQLERLEEMEQTLCLLGRMDTTKAAVLRLRFGLGGEEPKSRGEVGGLLRLSRVRVRQIELDGLRELRAALTAR